MQGQHEHVTRVGLQHKTQEREKQPLSRRQSSSSRKDTIGSRYTNSNRTDGQRSSTLHQSNDTKKSLDSESMSVSEELELLQARLDRAKRMVMSQTRQEKKEDVRESVVLTPSPFKSRVRGERMETHGHRNEEGMVEQRYSSERHWKVYERFSKVLQDASKEFDMNYVDDS